MSTDVLLFSQCGHALVHHYHIFAKGISHVITQSEAMDRWGQNEDTAQLSPIHGSSASPRSIRQRDSDEESPGCKARWACSPHMTDVPAVLMSPTTVSSRDPNAIIYDGRPSILPVSISLGDLAGDDVVVTVDLPSVIAPPGENGRESGGLQRGIWNRQSCCNSQATLILIWRMTSADFSHCRRQFRHYLRPVWWG